jgi:hypothetical protein
MNTIGIKVMLVTVALGAAVFALAGTASATHVSAVITVPDEVTVGQPTEVRAALRSVDGGLPLEGISVAFYTDASFGGVTGEVEIGQAVTDENGVAVLTYEPRVASQQEIRIEYLPPGESEPAMATTAISVIDGGTQLYRSSAGVDIPGLNVWLIIAVVSTVWLILLSVALRVVAIARAGGDAEELLDSVSHAGRPGDQPAASQSGAFGAR